MDKSMIESIIRELIREELGNCSGTQDEFDRVIDPSGIMMIDPNKVPLEKFPFPITSDTVWARDIMTVEESPRLGAGLLELEKTSFEWTLTYDEVDYVIDGTLEVIIDGRKVTAKAGQIVFIPKDTTIHFSTPDKARVLYVVYPANWTDLVDV